MKMPQWNKRFLTSTKGQIVALLRGSTCTVHELSENLGLTGNAVRAHLATLERDGLVQQSGLRPGLRKPHFAYKLTPEAEHLFPKSYGAILDLLLNVLGEHLSDETSHALLCEVGRRLAAEYPLPDSANIEERVKAAASVFHNLGGLANIERKDGYFVIRGDSCPLGVVSKNHPQICQMAAALVQEITQTPVRECCIRGNSPKCCFEVETEVRNSE